MLFFTYILLTLLFLYCAHWAHFRCKCLKNTLLHYMYGCSRCAYSVSHEWDVLCMYGVCYLSMRCVMYASVPTPTILEVSLRCLNVPLISLSLFSFRIYCTYSFRPCSCWKYFSILAWCWFLFVFSGARLLLAVRKCHRQCLVEYWKAYTSFFLLFFLLLFLLRKKPIPFLISFQD